MNAVPPRLSGSEDYQEPSAFAKNAANACLAAPLLICALCFSVSTVVGNHGSSASRPVYVICGLVATGLGLVGLLLGILSMVLARPGQRAPVMVRALCGLALLSLVAAIAVPSFVRARSLALERRQALERVHEAATDLRVQAATILTNSPGASADTRQLRRTLSQAAEKSSGDTAAILKSSELYLERMQPLQQAFAQATKDLTAARVLAASTLERREQIQDRKELVKKFLAANDACKNFAMHGEANFSNQLAAAAVSSEQMQSALNGFRKTSGPQIPLILSVRDADERMAQSMLAVLNLFDTQWGQWNYDTTAHILRFEDRGALSQYNALMADIKQAGAAEASASKRLAALMASGGRVSSL